MSMIFSETHFAETHAETQRYSGGFHFALTVLATAIATLILVPAAALTMSYLAGGAATSTILFVYLFAFLTNGPFLLALLAITAGAFAMPRVISSLAARN
jgi:hypothetical protein